VTHRCVYLIVWNESSFFQSQSTIWAVGQKQYVGKAASTIRAGLKEPTKLKASAQEIYAFKLAKWENGVQGPKVELGRAAAP
jgi:hypothetical protein